MNRVVISGLFALAVAFALRCPFGAAVGFDFVNPPVGDISVQTVTQTFANNNVCMNGVRMYVCIHACM